MSLQILVVDDERAILTALKKALEKEDMSVVRCETGQKALELAESQQFDLIVLDISLPDINGFTVLQKIRSSNNNTPVIVLSGRDEEYQQIVGLGLGADDYITKPFSMPMLISKIRALVRRNSTYQQAAVSDLVVGPFSLSRTTYRLCKNGIEIPLTSKELALMTVFLENPNQVFSKEQLYSQVWRNSVVDENTITVYIKRLRQKIEDNPQKPQYLKTIWGIGYSLSI
ncbi:MAG: response regulator transcription factor [Butyricicoccaceae bacterium]